MQASKKKGGGPGPLSDSDLIGNEHLSEPSVDYSKQPTTLVVFELEEAEGGTLLSVVESGFDGIPVSRRLEVFRMNSKGWDEQMQNIDRHVATH